MKNLLTKSLLVLAPMMMVACAGQKTSNNFFDTNIVTIAHEGKANVRLSDPNYNYQWSIEFIKDKLFDNIQLGGGLKGKTIADTIVLSEDLHSIVLTLDGKADDMAATEGTITVKPGALKVLNKEYEGFTFVQTFTLANETEYKLNPLF